MEFSTYKESDIQEIKHFFTKVFSDSEGRSEGLSIGNLVLDLMQRTASQDIFGFIATEKEKIIGSIFFTRLTFETPVKAYILSPVAIQTSLQGKGIGQKLVNFGIGQLKEKDVELVFTYGDPKFYSKVGFRCITEKTAKAPFALTQPEGWLCQSLGGGEIDPISGNSFCVEALDRPAYW